MIKAKSTTLLSPLEAHELQRIQQGEAASPSISLTGNPFVDTGLAAIANLAGLDKIGELSLDHLFKVHRDGRKLATWNSELKSFTMFFTTNSLLTQPSIRDKQKRIEQYSQITTALLHNIGRETVPRRCESCGHKMSLDLDATVRDAIREGEGLRRERFIGRDWFPLAGSMGSDAQSLPSASRSPALCALCLFAVHYAPLLSVLYEGRLAVFSSTSELFWYTFISNMHEQVSKRIHVAKNFETLGKREGTVGMVRALMSTFEKLEMSASMREIPHDTVMHVWQFSNAQTQDCRVREIPNDVLRFLHRVWDKGLKDELLTLIAHERRSSRYGFLQCVLEKRDYLGLYPYKKYRGTSSSLFALYQQQVMGRSVQSLVSAFKIASSFWMNSKKPEQFRSEFSTAKRTYDPLRKEIVNQVTSGGLSPYEYFSLFPLRADDHTRTQNWGWDLIKYYLWNHEGSDKPDTPTEVVGSPRTELGYCAARMYNELIERFGPDGFERKVMNRLARRDAGPVWIQLQFQRLARRFSGFTYQDWTSLFIDSNGRVNAYEPMFRMRLDWANSLALGKRIIDVSASGGNGDTLESVLSTSGLPSWLQSSLVDYADWIVRTRGIDRFEEVLQRFQTFEIGSNWIMTQLAERSTHFEMVHWKEYIDTEDGSSRLTQMFKVILFLANIYRVKHTINQ
jgi:hypothetical protein